MTRVPSIVLVVVTTTLLCSYPGSRGQERKSDLDAVVSGFPRYHLLTLKERDADTRAYILQHFPKANPSVVHADFDGDGHLDYALLLQGDKTETTKLVVLLCPEDGHCRSIYELDITGYRGLVYLRRVPPGSVVSQSEAIDSPNPPSPVKLKSPGIEVTYFGQAAIVLYWNSKLKKIETVQTED